MPNKITAIREKIEKLRDNPMKGLHCPCVSINDKLMEIDEEIQQVCCALCCDCHWNKIDEDLSWRES